MQVGSTNYYYSKDHLGSIRKLTDSSGAVQVRYDYDAYGRLTKVQGDLDSDFTYAGYYNHSASGLYATLNRLFDPNLGRWISRDPIEEIAGSNLYRYVSSNPVNFLDPLGLASLTTDMTAGLTVFNPNPEMPGPISVYPSRNEVTANSKPGAAGPYNSDDVYPTKGPYYNDPISYGPNDILRTDDERGRWLHGGGLGLRDPFAPRQGWAPTHGCTRLQNEDIQDLVDKIRDFKQQNPGVPVPYQRYNSPVGDFYSPLPKRIVLA